MRCAASRHGRKRSRSVALLGWLALLPAFANAAAVDVRAQPAFADATPRHVQDTESPDTFGPALDRAFRQFDARLRSGAKRDLAGQAPMSIDLVVHVLAGPAGEGDVSDATLAQQAAVLNDAYGPSGFRFNVADVRRYPNSPYFAGGCFPTTEEGVRMKSELAVDPARFVNIYTCELRLPYIAGYATLPNAYPEDDARHGIVVDYGALPGGAAPLELGHTLVHEVGHYFGLLHTFQGGCEEPGDSVSDTPAEAEPAYGCAVGRDTCPGAGPDPVKNFMDYSDDACADHFTPQQNERMRALVVTYRPSLVAPFSIGPGMTGHWFNAGENGHGFSIEVLPGNQMIAAWFVFAPNGGQAWIVASGSIAGDTAALDAYRADGPGARFPPHFDPDGVQSRRWGTLTFRFTDCNHGQVAWESVAPDFGNGTAPLTRLTLPAGLACP